jgi:uncharacterized membrane protein SpoIIM required for sporulation
LAVFFLIFFLFRLSYFLIFIYYFLNEKDDGKRINANSVSRKRNRTSYFTWFFFWNLFNNNEKFSLFIYFQYQHSKPTWVYNI